jgi:hypothetical protein
VPQDDRKSQRTLALYFHEQNGHCHDNAVYRLCRLRYWWVNMGKTISEDCLHCHTCLKHKFRTTLPYGAPKTSIPSYMPLCNICIDVADMVEAKDGYNQILVVVCRSTKYCVIIPWKKTWSSKECAFALWTKWVCWAGIPQSIQSDGARTLVAGCWPHLCQLMETKQLVSSAYNHSSNGLAERQVRSVRSLFDALLEGRSKNDWVMLCPTVAMVYNRIPTVTGMSPAMTLFGVQPRMITDQLHQASSLPDGELKDSLTAAQELIARQRCDLADRQQHAAEELAARQSGRYRNLPDGWGTNHATFWVYLNKEAYSRPEFDQAGTRNKMMAEKAAGPYLVTWVSEDGQTFDIERPEFMKRRTSDHFNVKMVREFVQQHAEPRHLVDAASDDDLDDGEHQVSALTGRRWVKKTRAYHYRVRWLGHADEPEAYLPEADISANRLITAYDEKWPRGCAKSDDPDDVAAYATEAAEKAAGRGSNRAVSAPAEPANQLKMASDAVLQSHPYNLRGSGHPSSLTAAETDLVDSAEVFSLYKPDWAVLTQSMARVAIRASEFLQTMVDAESMECFLAAPDYVGWN